MAARRSRAEYANMLTACGDRINAILPGLPMASLEDVDLHLHRDQIIELFDRMLAMRGIKLAAALLSAGVLALGERVGRRGRVVLSAGKGLSLRRLPLGRARLPLAGAVWALTLGCVVLPLAAVTLTSLMPSWGRLEGLSFKHWGCLGVGRRSQGVGAWAGRGRRQQQQRCTNVGRERPLSSPHSEPTPVSFKGGRRFVLRALQLLRGTDRPWVVPDDCGRRWTQAGAPEPTQKVLG